MTDSVKVKQRQYKRGFLAEYYAIIWLIIKGYRLIRHRYRCYQGEIDLIVRKGNQIAFIEVKYRQHRDAAMNAISRRQIERIQRAADYFLMKYPRYHTCNVRFDACLVTGRGRIQHLKGGF